MNTFTKKTAVVFSTTLLIGGFVNTTVQAAGHKAVNQSKMHLRGQISREISQADALVRENKFTEAEALYHDALNKDNTDVAARAGFGMALAKNFKLDRADEELNKALASDPNDPIALCAKAIVSLNRLQSSSSTWTKNKAAMLSEAEANCNRAIQADPKSPEAKCTLGQVLREAGRFDEAQKAFQDAIATDDKYSNAYAGLGMISLQKNEMPSALENFKQAIAINSANSSAHYGLGRAYLQQGQVDDAIRELNTSLYQFRNSSPVRFELGRAYEQQGNTVAAIREFQEAIRIKPEVAAPYIHIADIRENRGDIEHAVAELRSGLELSPNNPELLLRVANDNLRLEKIDDSIKDYEKVMAVAPRSTVAADGLSRAFYLKAQKESTGAFFASNDYEAAEKAIDKVVAMSPNNLELRLAQAKLYALSGKKIELSSMGTPQNEGERIAYAEALLAQNKFKEASDQMNMLVSGANTTKQMLALGDLAVTIRDLDSAEAAYKKALTSPDGAERAKRGLDQVAKVREDGRQNMVMAEDLLRKKQLASAVDKFHAAVFANPRNAEAHEGLAMTLEKLYPEDAKQLREAVVQYKAFIALTPNELPKDEEKLEKHLAKMETKATKLDTRIASVPQKNKFFGLHR